MSFSLLKVIIHRLINLQLQKLNAWIEHLAPIDTYLTYNILLMLSYFLSSRGMVKTAEDQLTESKQHYFYMCLA